jgi:hypothetical protein
MDDAELLKRLDERLRETPHDGTFAGQVQLTLLEASGYEPKERPVRPEFPKPKIAYDWVFFRSLAIILACIAPIAYLVVLGVIHSMENGAR